LPRLDQAAACRNFPVFSVWIAAVKLLQAHRDGSESLLNAGIFPEMPYISF
jgi:hypothetical protein